MLFFRYARACFPVRLSSEGKTYAGQVPIQAAFSEVCTVSLLDT